MIDKTEDVTGLSSMRFGAVFFDDPKNPADGWACIHGQDSERIAGTGDLPTDVIWISNLDFSNSLRAGLISHPNIKQSQFFRTDISALCREFGFTEGDNLEASIYFAEIFDRVVRLLIKHYNVKSLKMTLRDTLRPRLLGPDKWFGKKDLDLAIDNAWQSYQQCEGRTPKGSKILAFKFPRLDYARKILQFPVPVGEWRQVRITKDNIITPQDVAEKFAEKPILCKIVVRDVDPEISDLVSFSNGANNSRVWATGQEIYYLSKVAHVEIKAAFVCTRYGAANYNRQLIDEGKAGELSVSCGLIAENHWAAMSYPYTIGSGKDKLVIKSPRATWMRSWDRMLCFVAAKKFVDAGFHIKSYGNGGIIIAVPPSMLDYALEIASELKIVPPIHAINEMLNEFTDGLD